MTHSAQQGDVEISRLHNVAICKEISERLAIGMKLKPALPKRCVEHGLAFLRDAAAFDDAHETIAR